MDIGNRCLRLIIQLIKISVLLTVGCCIPVAASFESAPQKIAVFYPDTREPYRTIYQEILSGINQEDSAQVEAVELEKDFDLNEIISNLNRNKITKVIVLGRTGYQLAKHLSSHFNVVSGALPIKPDGISGISLISDPASLFQFLTQVAPEVKRVHVVYSHNNEWLIQLAAQAAVANGLELRQKEVNSTGEAIDYYNQLFNSATSKEDAIWLPLDNVSSHDKVTLPLILEKAWSREVVVFSSKPSHAKRGALFSTYPDNVALGKNLVQMVNILASNPGENQFAALKSLQLAVNLRTAAHLGLKYSEDQMKLFKVTFPE